ncbi:hypothetical protein F4808DRAFT_436515 [Astrocystis sublimbata]|nr:hypothetical protein F4808DRAFT_436515 [Astrocystis sublimbata]
MSAPNEKPDAISPAQPATSEPSNVPSMNPPPPYDQAQGQGQGTSTSNPQGPRTLTPLRDLKRSQPGPSPEYIKCPSCKRVTTIRRQTEPSDEAKFCLVCCGCLSCLTLGCCGSAGDEGGEQSWLEKIDMHCAACDKHLATFNPGEEIQVEKIATNQPMGPAAAYLQKQKEKEEEQQKKKKAASQGK